MNTKEKDLLLEELNRKKQYFSEEAFNILQTDIIEELNANTCVSSKEFSSRILKRSPEIDFERILFSLNKFEEDQEFLRAGLNLSSVATILDTNSKYLSKTINDYKKKTFTQYINDLRIEYLLKTLKKDSVLINYSIKAIALEIGFNTPNAFSRAFYKKTGLYPSEYIKSLN